MMEIYSLKLISGEEVISKIVSSPTDCTDKWVLVDPYTMMLMEINVGDGKTQVMPMPATPWILLGQKDTEIEIDDSFVMHVNVAVPKPIVDAYTQTITQILLSS